MSVTHFHFTTPAKLSNTTIFFLFAAPIIVILYASYVFNPAHAGNLGLYILQLIADSISIVVILSLWVTILMDVIAPAHHRPVYDIATQIKDFTKKPTVDILIPVAGEPLAMIEKTVQAAIDVSYSHKTFVLDDAKSIETKKLVEKLGAEYVVRTKKDFAKSGNLNHGIQFSKSDFFVILDADQVPYKNLIVELLPFMINENVAMVQSPQHFENRHEFIASGTAEAQDIFYKYVCPAKNISNSVFCVGTNVMFRRKAIDEIGGIALVHHSEDIWTSRLLHEKGWDTVFLNKILASGKAPNTIVSYFKQQLRWSKGGLSMLFLKNTLASEHLTLDQKLQYFSSNFFYLVGFSILCYLIFPIIYLLFGINGVSNSSSITWLMYYVPFFLLYYSLIWLLNGKLSIAPQAVAMATFYPYLLAFFSTVFGTKYEWVATTSEKNNQDLIMKWIWPHILIIVLSIFSLIIGWYDTLDIWKTLIFSFWTCWNMYLLVAFLTGENKNIHTMHL